jgi:hypothetical protein
VAEQLDWLVIVRVRAGCRRRYRRACSCRVPATATAPGPPKAIGKGLFTNAFLAMLFTERFVADRSMNSLVTGLTRHGADVAPGTLAGACAQAGALLAPLEDAITARSRRSWHLHADETTWRVLAPRDGEPARKCGSDHVRATAQRAQFRCRGPVLAAQQFGEDVSGRLVVAD